MAGDWIQMRVGLARDPRVLWMCDYLAGQRAFMNWITDPVQRHCDESAYEHVTRYVIASLCVTGLLQVWGMAREQGERIDDDLVVKFCDAEALSAIADIPCFGEAMIEAEWMIEQSDGSARLPNFFKQKKSPSDRFAKTGAERQREYRERKKEKQSNKTVTKRNVTNNGKVTKSDAREEKSKEENKKKDILFESLAEVCGIDWRVCTAEQRGELNQTGGILRKEGRTPEQVREVGRWWYRVHWKGLKGQAPTPTEIRQVWGQAFAPPARREAVIPG